MMTAGFPARVARLLPLLGSSVDAEALSAARAIERALKADQLDLHDLASAIPTKPRKPSEILTGVAPRRPSYVYVCTPRQEAVNREIARRCLQANRGQLRRRDIEFLSDVVARPSRLNVAQLDRLFDVAVRLELKDAA